MRVKYKLFTVTTLLISSCSNTLASVGTLFYGYWFYQTYTREESLTCLICMYGHINVATISTSDFILHKWVWSSEIIWSVISYNKSPTCYCTFAMANEVIPFATTAVRITVTVSPFDYWFFLSCALKVFEVSTLNGFWILASALRPNMVTGTKMKKATSSPVIRPGVKSWYRFKMPPVGKVALAVRGTASKFRTGRSGASRDWRL